LCQLHSNRRFKSIYNKNFIFYLNLKKISERDGQCVQNLIKYSPYFIKK